MTQEKLKKTILKLQVCSSYMANNLATCMINGTNNINTLNLLMILNDSIKLLLKYDLSENAKNCLTDIEFKKILNNSTTTCKICDCN